MFPVGCPGMYLSFHQQWGQFLCLFSQDKYDLAQPTFRNKIKLIFFQKHEGVENGGGTCENTLPQKELWNAQLFRYLSGFSLLAYHFEG